MGTEESRQDSTRHSHTRWGTEGRWGMLWRTKACRPLVTDSLVYRINLRLSMVLPSLIRASAIFRAVLGFDIRTVASNSNMFLNRVLDVLFPIYRQVYDRLGHLHQCQREKDESAVESTEMAHMSDAVAWYNTTALSHCGSLHHSNSLLFRPAQINVFGRSSSATAAHYSSVQEGSRKGLRW